MKFSRKKIEKCTQMSTVDKLMSKQEDLMTYIKVRDDLDKLSKSILKFTIKNHPELLEFKERSVYKSFYLNETALYIKIDRNDYTCSYVDTLTIPIECLFNKTLWQAELNKQSIAYQKMMFDIKMDDLHDSLCEIQRMIKGY